MPYSAKHKHAPVSARKARWIVDMVRGKGVSDALATLSLQPQRAAKLVFKVIRSAQANAENGGVSDVDNLFVSKIWVDEGMTLKRWRPRARGGAASVLRRRSHLCVELDVRQG
ncbi:MAG: 50S ribosomal protein L22 [Planctomycetes bacterium]|nr:50S ribosomal protein L22 [Planctomycetota bacterium]